TTNAEVTAPTQLDVIFSPSTSGEFSAALQLGELTIRLRGEGVFRETCTTNDPCAEAAWNDEAARCEVTPRTEGVTCSTACVTNGQCISGTCVGSAATCDDGDACTVDACDSARGCTHSARACESDNPCLAMRCDASQGCLSTDVEDGTSCGERDCSTAHICLSGACVERPVPNGASCGLSSYCQAGGVCVNGACSQPPARQLQLAWSRRISNARIDFPGLVDSAGNLFWFECTNTSTGCSLVSADSATGQLRYEVPTSFTGLARMYQRPTRAILAGELIVFGEDGALEARHHSDGSLAWTATLPLRAMDRRAITGLAARVPDSLYVAGLFAESQTQLYQPAFARLDLQTGALQWDHFTTGTNRGVASLAAPSVVIDSSGQPVFGGEYHQGVGLTSGFTEQGTVRWSTNVGPVAVVSVIGDRVFHSNMGWFDAQGGRHGVPRFSNTVYPETLDTSLGVVMVGVNSPRIVFAPEWMNWAKVPVLDFIAWGPNATQPKLNARGEISFAQSGYQRPLALYDFAPDGAPVAQCPFSVSPGESIEFAQPVVELPGLVVLVDSGRRVVWAYRR
ncbi:MAG: hypothetical protein JNM17_33245, partial [Archangium sp.]|nr:hypothetical protein [Archangium sp.]